MLLVRRGLIHPHGGVMHELAGLCSRLNSASQKSLAPQIQELRFTYDLLWTFLPLWLCCRTACRRDRLSIFWSKTEKRKASSMLSEFCDYIHLDLLCRRSHGGQVGSKGRI